MISTRYAWMMVWACVVLVTGSVSCTNTTTGPGPNAGEPEQPGESGGNMPEAPSGTGFVQVSPSKRLLRASMALKGVRPSLDEYDMVSADPAAYDALVVAYLESPEFGAMVRQHFTEWMELDQAPDYYPAGFPAIGQLSGLGVHELNTSIIQAAGRLAEHVVMTDRSWAEVVTADYTLADEVVATVWGLPYDRGAGGWQVTTYDDGRPVAGVLSDGWVFTRMPSTENNRNRERASLIANALICHDYPNRHVSIPEDLDLTSEAAINDAIANNPVCVSCHHTLDPLASFFSVHYPLRYPGYETSYPLRQYTPEGAADFESPVWYGQPADDLEDLGQLIADDPRFLTCAVRRFYSELMHVEPKEVPRGALLTYRAGFKRSGLNVKALVREIVLSDEFAAAAAGEAERDVGLRRATPQQLDSMVEELTGYRWIADVTFDLGQGRVGEVPLMRDYVWGYRTLAGGPNNYDSTEHLRTANPTTLLALRGLAERAARHVVEHDTTASNPRLLRVAGALDGEPDAVREQLAELHLRLYGERLDASDARIEAAHGLFEGVRQASGDVSRAWKVTLATMLQDARILYY